MGRKQTPFKLWASRFTSAIRWPPPRPVRPFPPSFVSFRRLHISSHALSLPAPCWAGKWLCRRAGSHAPQNKERATERRRSSKWKQASSGVGCTSTEPPSVCATARALFLRLRSVSSASALRGKKWEEGRNIRGWVFPSYCTFPVQPGSGHCTGKWWSAARVLGSRNWAADLWPTFKVSRKISLSFFFVV